MGGVLHGVCPTCGVSYMGGVLHGVCPTWGVSYMGCVLHGVCPTWGVLWGVSYMRCVLHGVCYGVCPTWGVSYMGMFSSESSSYIVHTCMVGRWSDLKDAVRGELVDVVDPVHSRKRVCVCVDVCGCVWMCVDDCGRIDACVYTRNVGAIRGVSCMGVHVLWECPHRVCTANVQLSKVRSFSIS